MFSDQITEGMKVRASEGENVGRVISRDANGFTIEKGIFFKKDYFVSYDAVTDIRDDEIYLSTSKDELGVGALNNVPSQEGFAQGVDFGDRDALGTRDEFGISPDSVEPVGTRATPAIPDDVDLDLDRAQTVDTPEPKPEPVKDAKDDKDVDKDAAGIDDEDEQRIPQ